MFIGHFAVGFAAKKFAPRTSLAPLIAAPLLADMLWPLFLLLGWERVRIVPGFTRFNPLDLEYYPWSHSLLTLLVWATLFAALYHGIAHYWPGTLAIWIGVVSHWILDWISHRPDMPLYPAGPKLGWAFGTRLPGPWWLNLPCSPAESGFTCWQRVRVTGWDVMRSRHTLRFCWRFISEIASTRLCPRLENSPGPGLLL